MTEEIEKISKKLSKVLKKDRYEHTIGVMYTSASLAMCHGADMRKAMLAGLLHDCGKFAPPKEQIRLCRKYGLTLSESELAMPALIHSKLGSYLAEAEYGIKDSEILNAISFHTTGRPNMSLLEKIVYLADYIEPNRKEIPGLSEVRHFAFTDIDQAVFLSAKATTGYLERGGKAIDPMTINTYHFYKKESFHE